MATEVPEATESDVRRVLEGSHVIAVLGAHTNPDKPAHYVPDYLHDVGYTVIGVNPRFAGTTLWGAPVRSELAEIDVPVDVVDVFRRSEHLPDHVDAILAMEPLPKVVWLQSGIRHPAVAEKLAAAGIEVIQDRCMLADHRRLFG